MEYDPELQEFCQEAMRENPSVDWPRKSRTPVFRRDQQLSEDYLSRLADRRRSRLALNDDGLDAMRFRYWFANHTGGHISLDDWRKIIDAKILEKPNG